MLPTLGTEEIEMMAQGLNRVYLGLIEAATHSSKDVAKYVKNQNWKSLKISSVTAHLT
ncbi:hypothetical protein ISU02_05475 [Fusibacter sp. Q10-2]|uniref:Uncharacterized protein n=1 Tax=Fusibacter ferrireducens TaxID=2785058 RepID=A0ABR9ZQF8_9FIRM|nr:hypothetical protein [Fusibacter ferrireducens]